MTKTTGSLIQNLRQLGLDVEVTDREGRVLEVTARDAKGVAVFAQWADGHFASGYTVDRFGNVDSHTSLSAIYAAVDAA